MFRANWQFLRQHPAFARVFVADGAAQIGQNMLVVAFPTLILEVTHDITLTGLAFTGEILAYGLLSPWAGWLADRTDPKRLMFLANWLRFGLIGLLLAHLQQGGSPWFCLLISLALGGAGALFSPARAAFLRRLLRGEDLLRAVAMEGTSMFLLRLLSPALIGVLMLLGDARLGIAVDGVMYLVSNLFLWPGWVNGPAPEASPHLEDGDWRRGWKLVLGSPPLRSLLIIDVAISFLGMASWSTAVAYLEQVLQVRAANNAWLQASMGVTGALGTCWVHRFRRGPALVAGLLGLIVLSYLALGRADSLFQLVLVWSLRGLAVGAMVVVIAQQLASEVPASAMGRVQAAWEQAALLACFLGSAMTPWLLRTWGAQRAFEFYGQLAVLGLLSGGLWLVIGWWRGRAPCRD